MVLPADQARFRERLLRRVAWSACAGVVLLSACTRQTPEAAIREAEAHLSRRENKEALIELRNAVKLAPENGKAYRLLGSVLVRLRDLPAAERALREALQWGEPPEEVLPILAMAMNGQGRQEQLLNEFGARQFKLPAAEASWQSSLGQAWLRQGDSDKAAHAFEAALAAVPGYAPARLGQARIAAQHEHIDEASTIVDEVIQADPEFAEAFAFKAQLLIALGRAAQAKQALQRAVDIDAGFLAARVALVSMQIRDRQFDEAKKSLLAAGPEVANDARVVFLGSELALRTGNLPTAHEQILRVLKEKPDYLAALVLAGEIELRSNSLAAAEGHLKFALRSSPSSVSARRLLAATYLHQGKSGAAIDTLQPLLQQPDDAIDPDLAKLAAEAYLASGDSTRAEAIFKSLRSGAADDGLVRLRLGQMALAQGDFERGMAELQAASALDTEHADADLALVALHLRRNEPTQALAAAQALQRKQPQNAQAHVLLGLAQMTAKDMPSARRSFEAALKIQPDHLPAARALAELDLAERRPDEAKELYAAMLRKKPDDNDLLVAMAELQERSGDEAGAVATLRRAVAAHPSAPAAQLMLVRLQLRGRDPKAAVAVVQEAVNANPDQPRLVELLGDTQQASGATDDAARTFQRLAALEPDSMRPLLKRAAILETRRDFKGAAETLRRAQQISPAQDAIARRLVADLLAADGFDDAVAAAKALQVRKPSSALGYTLEGNAHASRRKWREAERAYRDALSAEPHGDEAAIQLSMMMRASGRSQEAAAFTKDWLKQNPADVRMRIVVADAALKAADYKAAVEQYESVLKGAPDNVVALNNLAWTLGKLKDPRALAIGERAAAQVPTSPEALDTLGVLYLERGDPAKALDLFERVRSMVPDRADMRLHRARALLLVGRVDEGKGELRELASSWQDPQGKAEVAALLRQR